MGDHGRPLLFGYFLEPVAAEAPALLAAARRADELGLDLIGIQDHPYQRRFLDTWTLLSAIGAQTSRIRLFPDVASLPLRHPAMLAKAVASLDVLTDGRVELGLGAGAFWDPIAAMGFDRRTPGEAVSALEEAIDVIRLWWSDASSVRYDGRFYPQTGPKPGPRPAHDAGIWLGAYGPRMLDLVGRKADGWLPSLGMVGIEKLGQASAAIDSAARDAGRDPGSIERITNLPGEAPGGDWVGLLTELAVEHGINGFVFGGGPDVLERVADEIAPAVRESVAAAR
ncbi:MAG TPA: LLM class flavin-dependent oxidoreductase [Nocardioidaceae bacterium]|nr:LLM class flavin-dependent oxidoreductase [Nocardioidaceae bacterium]